MYVFKVEERTQSESPLWVQACNIPSGSRGLPSGPQLASATTQLYIRLMILLSAHTCTLDSNLSVVFSMRSSSFGNSGQRQRRLDRCIGMEWGMGPIKHTKYTGEYLIAM